ncbi:hypothetical protein BBI17_001000 [Phytophthora kernoviae]|uniref:PH domain-containing protein n=2 Tax=Phytophthora kernoviae TaxID=325452 RepID=A0A3R7J9S4_9STRA|nr:hypothetical protein G195_001587 [Phytophthora kernoviae 00238/432]RLN44396.1 hypothetical protein BBI17_001000 [Phytophthora kernoviae]
MQPWTGDRRRERSSSVVLLKGKLSAIVRRGSIFQAEPEEGRGSNSSHSYSKEEGEEADESDGRHSNSSSTVSTMTMWDPSASRNAQRFQFYPTRSLVAAALARPLGEDEVARRVSLEAKINSFETIHMNFAPMEVSDKQEGKKEEEMDNNEIETLEEEERRAALEDDEDEESADDEESEGFGGDEEYQELETIEGARWKIVELAFRFGGKHRAYLVQAINMFFPLLKYGRRGGGHATRLHCNLCGTLQWQHKRGGLSEAVDLAGVLQVLEGRQTAVFLKYPSSSTLEECSFSVVFLGRTLDLETQSPSHRDWLVSALRTLVSYARRQRRIEQQAIAERTILPLDDDVPLVTSRARASSSRTARAHRRREDSTKMAALSPNYKIRTVY